MDTFKYLLAKYIICFTTCDVIALVIVYSFASEKLPA